MNEKTILLLSNLIKLRVDSLNTAKQRLKELESEQLNCKNDIEDTLKDIDDYNLAITKLKQEFLDEVRNKGTNKPASK